jgi:hypothetical protein
LGVVPAAAKNTSAAIIKTFSGTAGGWIIAGGDYLKMTFRIPAVSASQYVRLRGTNMPAGVPYETDADGNPLADLFTNANDANKLSIPCSVTPTTPIPVGSTFTGTTDGCPAHMATAGAGSPISGQKAVSFDVAAWADLWFYSNPIYVEVATSTVVAGVQ